MGKGYELIGIKTHVDYRGQLKKIAVKSMLEQGQEIEEVYVLYSEKGIVRGNHYHEKTIEYFTVLSGEALMVFGDINLKAIETKKLKADDNQALRIDPYIVHAIKNESEEPLIVLAVSLKEYNDADTDTFPVNIIK
ncbi:MAG: cupin domain-containing protein [Lutisporaceae bacterium]